MSDAPAAPPTVLEHIALELLALEGRRERLRAELLVGMAAAGLKSLKVAGGSVSYVASSSPARIDGKAAEARIKALAAQLVALGQPSDDSIPLTVSNVAASVRVTPSRHR